MRITENDKFYIIFYIEHKKMEKSFCHWWNRKGMGTYSLLCHRADRYPHLTVCSTNKFKFLNDPDDEHPIPLTSKQHTKYPKWIVSSNSHPQTFHDSKRSSFIQENNSGFHLGKIIDYSETTLNKIASDIFICCQLLCTPNAFEGRIQS
jgi:hypothetical protein